MSESFRYKIIGYPVTFKNIKNKVKQLQKEDWLAWGDRKIFKDQEDSLTIPLYNLPDKNSRIFNKKIINERYLTYLSSELFDCYSLIDQVYPHGEPKRVLLVNLPAGKQVLPHTDSNYHLVNSRRIHLPIITNDKVQFFCEDTIVPMHEGTLIDFNNNVMHYVSNNSNEDRIHLIIDWGLKNDPFYE